MQGGNDGKIGIGVWRNKRTHRVPVEPPAVTLALTLTVVSLLGYSAMVGAVGGGGLGDLGIRYGYQRFMPEVMATVVLVLIALVQGVQTLGEAIARRLDKRTRNS